MSGGSNVIRLADERRRRERAAELSTSEESRKRRGHRWTLDELLGPIGHWPPSGGDAA
jgi:hypothetical protein